MAGGREETVSDAEILWIFVQSDDPFLFTGEVADELGFSNNGAASRLKDLSKRNLLAVKRAGRVPGWWITEEGREFLAGDVDEDDLPEP
jgi:Mn-dependent DtxR family transcriptional regulator